MLPIDDFAEASGAESITIALTGDGSAETKILRAMAERHNGKEHALKLPEAIALLGHENMKPPLLTGYSALRKIQTYIIKFGFTRFLFILDVEHVDNPQNIGLEITKSLTRLGYNSLNIEKLADQAYLTCCSLGAYEISIYVVVCGKEKCIEENIAALIMLEHGMKIAPNKRGVSLFLDQKGLSLYRFIKGSKSDNLKAAFKDLVAVFENMEKIYNQP
jgi:hypothetical protein